MKFPNIEYFPSFWENGMKLGADHFKHLEDSIEDGIRDGRALALLNAGGYGLLPNSPFQLMNAQGQAPQSVRVVLNACRAVLPGGFRVEIIPENVQAKEVPVEAPYVEFIPSPGQRYHLFLSINERTRAAAGIMESRPIRRPYLVPEYHMECVTQEKRAAFQDVVPNRMKIAEWQDGKILQTYVPAALCIRGNQVLVQWYQYFEKELENLVLLCRKVILENRMIDLGKQHMAVAILQFIRSRQGQFKWDLPDQSPVRLVSFMGDLCGVVLGFLEYGDRDFVRNQLQNGKINELEATIQRFLGAKDIPHEEVLMWYRLSKKFLESLLLTMKSLLNRSTPQPKSGDRNIASG